MKHDWKTESGARVIGEPRKRKCRNCGAIQEYREQSYDRLLPSSYAWRPLIGKCYVSLKRLREWGAAPKNKKLSLRLVTSADVEKYESSKEFISSNVFKKMNLRQLKRDNEEGGPGLSAEQVDQLIDYCEWLVYYYEKPHRFKAGKCPSVCGLCGRKRELHGAQEK